MTYVDFRIGNTIYEQTLICQGFLNLYNRVYERTKFKMKAYTAVQRKLLILIYTLWKKNEAFKNDIHPEMGTRLLSFR
jgi:hypothetical protein